MIPAITKIYYPDPTLEKEQEYRDYVREINDNSALTWQDKERLTREKAEELGI